VVPGPGTSHETTATASDSARTDDGTDPESACRQLQSALAQARQAAQKVTSAVRDGCPPQEEDLAPLAALGAVFDSVDAVLRTAGIEGVPRRLEDVTCAVRAHRAAHERDLRAREPLRELLDVASRSDSSAAAASAAEAVRGAARRLLDTPVWEEPQREESAALAALARLIRLGRQAEAAAEILVLQEQVVRVLPTCAMAVVMAPELTLAKPEDAGREPTGAGADGTPQRADAETTVEYAAVQPAGQTAESVGQSTKETAPEHASKPEAAKAPEPGCAHHAEAAPPADTDPVPLTDPDVPALTTAREPVHAADAHATPPAASDPAPPTDPGGPVSVSAVPTICLKEDTPAREAGPAVGDASDDAVAERALAQLVADRRFGLAHHLARATGHPEPQVAALRLAAAAALLTSGDSQGARLTADLLQQYGGYAGHHTEGSELLVLPALLRTALITGDHSAGAQLKALAPRLPDRLAEAATTVADRALSGALLIASPLVADVSETEVRLRELREQSRALLVPQRLRFAGDGDRQALARPRRRDARIAAHDRRRRQSRRDTAGAGAGRAPGETG
jgi:hypothetical protein